MAYSTTYLYCLDCSQQGFDDDPFEIRDIDSTYLNEYVRFCPFCGSQNIGWIISDDFYTARSKVQDKGAEFNTRQWFEEWRKG